MALPIAYDLQPGDHVCHLYQTDEEHRTVITAFLRQGLEQHQKVLYIVDGHAAATILGYLRDDGVAVEPYLESGQLALLTRDDAYLRGGAFDPDGMIAVLRQETTRALAEGYTALRITGEMTWALRGLPGSERLIEYENKLNQFFPRSRCLALCQYDCRRFDAKLLLDILYTHPQALVGLELLDNLYYIPPEERLGKPAPEAEFQRRIENLRRHDRAMQALQQSEAYHRAIFDSVNDAIFVDDADTIQIIDLNETTCRMYGYPREALLKMDIGALSAGVHPYTQQEAAARLRKAREGEPQVFEWLARHSSGRLFWVEVSIRFTYIRGAPRYIVAVRDITERKEAQQALAEQREFMDYVIRHDPNAIAVFDSALRYLFVSERYLSDYGVQEQDVIGKHHYEVFPEIPQRWREVHRRVLSGAVERSDEDYFERPDGTSTYTRWECRPWYRADGAIGGMITYTEVITERILAEMALRRSEQRLALALEAANDGLWDWNVVTGEAYFSPQYYAMLGYEPGAFPASYESWRSLVHPDDLEAAEAVVRSSLANQEAFDIEFRLRASDGSWRWIRSRGRVMELDEQGTPIRMVGTHVDISESKQRDREMEAIAALSAALRTAQRRAEMPPIILSQTVAALSADGAALETLQPNGDITTELATGIWAPATGLVIPPGAGLSAQVLATGQPYLTNAMQESPCLYLPDLIGECRAVAGVPLITQEQIVGLLWVGSRRNLSEADLRLLMAMGNIAANALQRASLHEQTAAQAERVRQIIDTVPEGVLLLDPQHRVVLANPAAECALDLLAGDRADNVLTRLGNRPLSDWIAPTKENRWHEVKVDQHIFEIVARPMEGHAEREGWVLVTNDVTEVREARRHLEQQERLAVVGQLSAGIAHDFNNILAAITLYAQLALHRTDVPAELHNYHRVIVEQASRAADLVRQILDFSRRAMIQRQPLIVCRCLTDVIGLLRRTLPESIRIELTCRDEDLVVHADPTRVQQALLNLALNARDAMPGGGELHLEVQWVRGAGIHCVTCGDVADGEWALISVRDSGTGIAQEAMEHLFEPFFTTKGPGEGSGLGLPQVYGIVKQHDGHIDVQNLPGSGAVFQLYWPTASLRAGAEPAKRAAAQSPRGNKETILVVEDDPMVRSALVDALSVLNYSLVQAANGAEALAVLADRAGAVDLVLSDWVMPDRGGQEWMQALYEQYPAVQALMLTGYPLGAEVRAAAPPNVVGWLQKPPDIQRLTDAIAEALHRRRSP